MTNYPLGDFLIRLKNASLAGNKEVEVTSSKLVKETAICLKNMGFLDKVEEKDKKLFVSLSFKDKKPVLLDLKVISRPGLRIYMSVDEIGKIKRPSVFVISSPKGIISSRKAVKERVGGEIIVEIW